MSYPTECPNCKANLVGEDIFEKLRSMPYYKDKNDEEVEKSAGDYGWTRENRKTFMRVIYCKENFGDGGKRWWRCPDCGHDWQMCQ